jgi:antitoxin component YwqK of YwqJK toxin-antitoxin module
MKLKFILPLFILLANSAIAQLPGTVWPKGKPGVDFNLKNARGQKEGLWIRTHQGSSNIFSKGTYKTDVPVGTWEKYYPTGELQSIQVLLPADSVNTTTYHPDGKTVMAQGLFVKRKMEGRWKMYTPSGALKSDEIYQDSLLNGLCKYYYDNGKMLKTEVYKNNEKQGPFTEYFENGKKRAEGTYFFGEKDGDYKAWFDNGALESEGKFVKGAMDGVWYFYNNDGTVKVAMVYKLGVETKRKYQNGTIKESYDSGVPKSEYTYEDGKKDGPFAEWYDKGEYVLVEPDDPEMKKIGYQKLEMQGTQLRVQGDYHDDKLMGDVIYYFEDGRIEKIEEWNDGVLILTKQAAKP